MKQGFEKKIKTYASPLSASLPNTGEGEVDKTHASYGSVSEIVENMVEKESKKRKKR